MTRPSRVDPTVALLVVLTGLMTIFILAVIYLVAFVDPDPDDQAKRISYLLDKDTPQIEIGTFAADGMYKETVDAHVQALLW